MGAVNSLGFNYDDCKVIRSLLKPICFTKDFQPRTSGDLSLSGPGCNPRPTATWLTQKKLNTLESLCKSDSIGQIENYTSSSVGVHCNLSDLIMNSPKSGNLYSLSIIRTGHFCSKPSICTVVYSLYSLPFFFLH